MATGDNVIPELPEAEAEEEETDQEQSTDDEHQIQGDGAAAGGKKKKKKKKKKKAAGGAGTGSQGSSSDSEAAAAGAAAAPAAAAAASGAAGPKPPDKQEADRRFHKALDSAKQGEDMWVLLADANLHDAKVKKLFEALRNNSSITSVNLSANHIGDEGVQALVNVLQQGGCSELIDLDLRGNELSPEAEALLADLGKKRKQLAITTGPIPAPEPEGGSSSGGGGGKPAGGRGRGRGRAGASRDAAAESAGSELQQQQSQQRQQQVFTEQSLKELAKTSPMFRRYFQMADEEADEGSSGDEEGEHVEQLPAPEEVWDKVCELLPAGADSIPELSAALVTVSRALDAEMASMPANEEEAVLEDFQPHFRAVVQHLPQLQQVLELQPPPKVHQSRGAEPRAAVGSHRVWAAGILHMLLLHNNAVIDRAVCDAGLLPTVLALAFQHDRCSAVQCRAVEMLRCSLQSSVQELWRGLFEAGYGRQLQQPGADGQLVPPLHEALVEFAASTQQQAMGSRPCATGFAVEVANTLLQASDGASGPEQQCPALAALLQDCAAWQSSIAPDGPIHALLKEQDGHLCGPPPPRPAPSVDSMEEGEGGSLEHGLPLMNGNQIMALLSCMGELP